MKMTTRKAQAIIGAGYGDEGKGLTTDFLAFQSAEQPVVVRYNGGAQAGHTVQTPDGRRHVFGHFGSGSFAGCSTYLSRFFVANPIVFLKERVELQGKGLSPHVMIDPRAPVTTPFDMLINQAMESLRGTARHGSCGLGFGETLARTEKQTFALYAADLSNIDVLTSRLRRIREDWIPLRFQELGLETLPEPWCGLLASDALLDHFLRDVQAFSATVEIAPQEALHDKPLIFEGAQGLMLDPSYGFFPHVTRSATGLQNILLLCQELQIDQLDAYYVSRVYKTRHGAGPLPFETKAPPLPVFEDQTNKPNPFQGALRFGLLDLDELARLIRRDYALAATCPNCSSKLHLALTCLDQATHEIPIVCRGQMKKYGAEKLGTSLKKRTQAIDIWTSYGPTRHTFSKQTL